MGLTVTLHTKEIRITLEEGTLNHLIIKNFIQKYFSSVMTLSETLIIFHKESEISQKKYFFQWLYAAYSKKRRDITPVFLKTLQSALSFPIRVRITGKKRPVQAINIHISYISNELFSLHASPASSAATNYLRFRFKDFLKSGYDSSHLTIRATKESIDMLNILISRNNLLAQPVIYIYNKIDLRKIIEATKTEKTKKEHIYNLIIQDDSKLLQAYKTLGCKEEAPLDEIKKSYRKLAFKLHPDRFFGAEASIVEQKTKEFHLLNSAYELISSQQQIK